MSQQRGYTVWRPLSKPGCHQTPRTPLAASAQPKAPLSQRDRRAPAPWAFHFLPRAPGRPERLTRSPRPTPSAPGARRDTHSRGTTPRNGGVGLEQAGAGGRAGGPAESGAGAGRGRSRGVGGWPASSGAQGRGGPPPASPGRSVPSSAGLAAPPSPEVPSRDPELPPPREAATRGRGHCGGWYQRAEKKLGLLSPQVRDTSQRRPPLALPPHPLLCFPTSPPPKVPPQGTGLPAAGRNSTQITWSGELGRGATRGVGGPSHGGCAGSPSPEPGERRGAGGAPSLGDTAERPGAGGRSGGPGGEGQEGPGTPLGAPRRGRGAWAPGVPGPGRGRAPHSPSCRRRRPRPRPARSRPPSTCSRRCPAPTGRRSTGASASAAASSRLGRRPRPLLASLPGAAAGAGRGGAEEGEGRGGSSSGAAGGEGGARPAPELRPGRERRAAPEQEAAAAEAARGSGSKGRPIGGGCGGPARAEEGITASPPRRRAGPTGRASAGRRPATPVSDRWPPGARGARAHVRTHTGARTRDPGRCCRALPGRERHFRGPRSLGPPQPPGRLALIGPPT